jgi:hypothetical protein
MKSIRISDDVYAVAQQEAALMNRSLAQQIEHWVRLALAMEAAGVTLDQVRQMLGSDRRTRERVLMKMGIAAQESMYLIPSSVARQARITFPSAKTLDAR